MTSSGRVEAESAGKGAPTQTPGAAAPSALEVEAFSAFDLAKRYFTQRSTISEHSAAAAPVAEAVHGSGLVSPNPTSPLAGHRRRRPSLSSRLADLRPSDVNRLWYGSYFARRATETSLLELDGGFVGAGGCS